MDNRTIAKHLLKHAAGLEAREPNRYRIRAYRRAADSILALDRSVAEIVEREGRQGLELLPGIGAHLSHAIETLVRSGEWPFGTSQRQNAAATRD
jgi:DNA polymerase (family 10)